MITPTKSNVRQQLMSMLKEVCLKGEKKSKANKARAALIRSQLRELDA